MCNEVIDYRDTKEQSILDLDYETMWWGRHFRLEDGNKVIVARDQTEGERFRNAYASFPKTSAHVSLKSEKGPVAIIILDGELTEDLKDAASFLISKHYKDKEDREFLFEHDSKEILYSAGEFKKYDKQPIKVANSYHIHHGIYKEIV